MEKLRFLQAIYLQCTTSMDDILTLSKKNLLSHLYWGAQVSMEIS